MIYMQSSLADIYLGSVVNGFSNGSIIVDYTVNFRNDDPVVANATGNSSSTPTMTSINSSTIMTAFQDSLMMSVDMGIINVTIDENSIMVVGEFIKIIFTNLPVNCLYS